MTKLSQLERDFVDLLRQLDSMQLEDLKRILEVFKAQSLRLNSQDANE